MAVGEVTGESTGSDPVPAERSDAGQVATGRPSLPPVPVGPQGMDNEPLTPSERIELDEVIAAAERVTGLRFAVYLGELGADLGGDVDTGAREAHAALGAEAPVAALLAVSPGQRVVQVVTGGEAARRISDRSARLAVLATVASVSQGDLLGGLVNGIRTLADQAGTLPERADW